MATHELKTWCAYFEKTWNGSKPFEIRYEDRAFEKGDTVVLREFDRSWPCECTKDHAEDCAKYSGREIEAVIGFITQSTPGRGQQRGFSANGYVVFGLCEMKKYRTEVTPGEKPVSGKAPLIAGPVVGANVGQQIRDIAAAAAGVKVS
jgi:hypothetical protein